VQEPKRVDSALKSLTGGALLGGMRLEAAGEGNKWTSKAEIASSRCAELHTRIATPATSIRVSTKTLRQMLKALARHHIDPSPGPRATELLRVPLQPKHRRTVRLQPILVVVRGSVLPVR
jgi:hypothetical protein